MPVLKGDVEILGLGNLLQLLAMNHKEGILTLIRGDDRKTIHFATKGMRLLSSSMKRINKLGKILLRRKRISKATPPLTTTVLSSSWRTRSKNRK